VLINVEVAFVGELPIYLPVPDRAVFATEYVGVDLKDLRFEAVAPKRHPDEGGAHNMDDGMGNYVRSRVRMRFRTKVEYDASSDTVDPMVLRGVVVNIVNQFVDACRYVARDPKLTSVRGFPGESVFQVFEISDDGKRGRPLPVPSLIEASPLPSPFGIGLKAIIGADQLRRLSTLFDGQESLNPAWLLWLDAQRDAYFARVEQCILNLAIALEIHIPNLVEEYKSKFPESIDPDDIDFEHFYTLYDKELEKLVGSSLHVRPDLIRALEYIRVVRNGIAHRWMPIFDVSRLKTSKYIADHVVSDGHVVSTVEELHELVDVTNQIMDFVEALFARQYP
jgi:hypothetical protein